MGGVVAVAGEGLALGADPENGPNPPGWRRKPARWCGSVARRRRPGNTCPRCWWPGPTGRDDTRCTRSCRRAIPGRPGRGCALITLLNIPRFGVVILPQVGLAGIDPVRAGSCCISSRVWLIKLAPSSRSQWLPSAPVYRWLVEKLVMSVAPRRLQGVPSGTCRDSSCGRRSWWDLPSGCWRAGRRASTWAGQRADYGYPAGRRWW